MVDNYNLLFPFVKKKNIEEKEVELFGGKELRNLTKVFDHEAPEKGALEIA
jgi:hypothetical protein